MAEQLIPFINGVQYNGLNGAAILDEMDSQDVIDNDISIISESGGVLVLGYENGGPNSITYQTGEWVTWKGNLWSPLTDATLATQYIKRSDLP